MVCLDTSVVLDLTGRRGKRRLEQARAALIALGHATAAVWRMTIPIFVLAELFEGIERARQPDLEEAKLQALLADVDVLEFDQLAARAFGAIAAELSRKGTPIADMDALIAAVALRWDQTLVTANVRDFGRVPGLRLVGYR